jgi:predicted phage terminase large subunit-like protein
MRTELNPEAARAALAHRREQDAIAEEAATFPESFILFVPAAWPVLEPTTPYVPNWHVDAICAHLEAAAAGEISRLLINIPPRHMKTTLVSVMWPAWLWTHKPHLRFLTASYGANLAERDAVRARDLIRSPWYQQRWPLGIKNDVNRTNRYENTATGCRVATGVGGEATGEGGDVIIIDDPHKLEEAMSGPARARVIDWHDGTMSTRLNDPNTGVEVVVMQRHHERDLSGHLLDRSGWTHLCLPSRYESRHPFVWPDDPRTQDGELLWPEHVPETALAGIEHTMGSFRAAGQLQQRPAAAEGDLLNRRWWRFFEPAWLEPENLAMLPAFTTVVSSWDTAFEDKTSSDYVVGQLWGLHGPDRCLLRSYRRHANLHQTKDAMADMYTWGVERWPGAAHSILIEKSANGAEISSQLRHELPGVTAVIVSTDKITRAIAAAPPLESGNVFVPGRATPDTAAGYQAPDWVTDLIDEAAAFPKGRYDDQVDAYSQAMNWASTRHQPILMRTYVPDGRIDTNPYTLGLQTHAQAAARDLAAHNPVYDTDAIRPARTPVNEPAPGDDNYPIARPLLDLFG